MSWFISEILKPFKKLAVVHTVIVYHCIYYSVSNSFWARSMYAVTVKPMCSLINTVLQMIRHLACSCLFAREHNISGDEKSSDHAKPRQNRGVQFSYYKHQSLPGATGKIFRGKQRSRRFCRVTQTKSNPYLLLTPRPTLFFRISAHRLLVMRKRTHSSPLS